MLIIPNFLVGNRVPVDEFISRPEKIFGSYARSKTPYIMQSFSDSMFYTIRAIRPALNRTGYGAGIGDDNVRGYNADPASMTKLDLLISRALDQAAYIMGIKDKDWDAGQRSKLVDKIIIDIIILFILRRQYQCFEFILAPEEDDAFTTGDELTWSFETLEAVTHAFIARKYPILNVSLQLARLLTVVFRMSPGYSPKGIPPSFYSPYDHIIADDTPTKSTVAVFDLYKSFAITLTEGLIHAQKISLPWKPFTKEMVTKIEVFPPESRLGELFNVAGVVYYFDGSNLLWMNDKNFYDDEADQKILPISPTGNLDEIFSLLPFICDVYHVDNNPYCINDQTGSTVTEDRVNVYQIAHNASVITPVLDFDEFLCLFPIMSQAVMCDTSHGLELGGAVNANVAFAPKHIAALQHPNMLSVSGITQTRFEDAFEAKLIKLITGGDLLADSGSQSARQRRTPKSKKTTVRKRKEEEE